MWSRHRPTPVPSTSLCSCPAPSARTRKSLRSPPAGLRGAEAVTLGPALSWGTGTRGGTSQGQPEEPGGCSEPARTVRELRIYPREPGPGSWGSPPELPSVAARAGREQIQGGKMEMHNRLHRLRQTNIFSSPLSFQFSSSPAPAVPLSALLISLCAPLTRTLLSKQVQLPLNRL